MNETANVSGNQKQSRPWMWLVLSIMLFGIVMGFRDELHSVWLRALMAGAAFAILFPAVHAFRRRP